MRSQSIIAVCFFLSVIAAQPSSAQTVEKVRGQSVLVNGGDMVLNSGDEYFTVTDTGKKTGLIKISQVRGQHAVGKIEKGVVNEGQSITLRGKSSGQEKSQESSNSNIKPIKKGRGNYGLLVGYSMDSLSMTAADNATPTQHAETASLSGTSMKLKGFYDYPVNNSFTLRFDGGYDGFNGTYGAQSSVINKDGSTSSKLSATFLALEGEVDWNFIKKSTKVYLTLGYSFFYVMSLSTNLYSLSLGASYLNSVYAGIGANIKMSDRYFLPVFVHYNYFNAGSGVSQSAMNLGLGWGWNY